MSLSTNIVFNLHILTCIYPKCIESRSMQPSSSLHFIFFFSPNSPFLQLSAFFSPKIAESRECGRIESQLADWIVFCSISGCIKRLRLWTYKKVMDASSLRLDRSELTSAEGRKGTKKSVIYWPSRWRKRRGWMPLSSHCWQIQRRAPTVSLTGFLPNFFPP